MTTESLADDDPARIFRENDDLGSDSNVLLRPIRHLLASCKPPGPMTAFSFPLPGAGSLPFAVLTWTERNRLVFWPILPNRSNMAGVVDHVTLEFPSQRSHRTAYNETGNPVRECASKLGHNTAWRLTTFPDTGVALWMTLAVRTELLLDQDLAVQRRVKMPTSAEANRITDAFVRHYQQLNLVDVPLPPGQHSTPSYICCNVLIVTDPNRDITLTSDMFLASGIGSRVDGWPDDAQFLIQPIKVSRGGHDLIFATACPPGELTADICVGLPRPTSSAAQ